MIFRYFKDADDPNTCCAKQVNETEKHNVASDFEASADVGVSSFVSNFNLLLHLLSTIFVRGSEKILMCFDFIVFTGYKN